MHRKLLAVSFILTVFLTLLSACNSVEPQADAQSIEATILASIRGTLTAEAPSLEETVNAMVKAVLTREAPNVEATVKAVLRNTFSSVAQQARATLTVSAATLSVPQVEPTPTDTSTPPPPTADIATISATKVEPTITDTPTPPPPTATQTPTRTSTPNPTPLVQAMVNTDVLNLREGPSTNFPIKSTVKQGDVLSVVGRNSTSDWLLLELDSSVTGWVFAALVQVSVPISDILQVSEPEPPFNNIAHRLGLIPSWSRLVFSITSAQLES